MVWFEVKPPSVWIMFLKKQQQRVLHLQLFILMYFSLSRTDCQFSSHMAVTVKNKFDFKSGLEAFTKIWWFYVTHVYFWGTTAAMLCSVGYSFSSIRKRLSD